MRGTKSATGAASRGSVGSRALRALINPASLCAVTAVLLFAVGASADDGSRGREHPKKTFVAPGLQKAVERAPDETYDVIVQASRGNGSAAAAAAVRAESGRAGRALASIDGVAVQVTGRQLARLAARGDLLAITPDAAVHTDVGNKQSWPASIEATKYWSKLRTQKGQVVADAKAPTVAVVDSGIAARTADFGARVVAAVTLTGRTPNSAGDGRGHGTFVANIIAGESNAYAGATPNIRLVSLDVIDDTGVANTSDVIAAADWILEHKDKFNIRVANFSLHSTTPGSFLYDPLNRAVQRLWFSGVVVVAAAGNYATDGARSGVPYAPGNDPFVITVGAADTKDTETLDDDVAAPWSASGYTVDGFLKPELGAPGRYLNSAAPAGSTMWQEFPSRRLQGGEYMWMSGTSFAAAAVSGAAAAIVNSNPTWTPDQVKGALMLTAQPPIGYAVGGALGVGEPRIEKASKIDGTPPNPNAALYRFVTGTGGAATFDGDAWLSTVQGDASWNSASWNSASWNSASWNSSAWSSASWNSASWNSASWNSGATAASFPTSTLNGAAADGR